MAWRHWVRIAVAAGILATLMIPAYAADRVALVIGNGAYQNAGALPNPPNDAADVAQALRAIGFDVVEGRDLDKRAMEERIQAFSRKLDNADMALFFYAGHGMQVAGRNYLVPVDAKVERAGDLSFQTIDVTQVLAQMEAEKRVNLVFLDACRDNPISRSLARSMGTRSGSVGNGLASIQSGVGTMIAYATQPDAVALDGDGRNSPFTTALLKHVRTPGLDISVVMRRIRADVVAATRSKQIPWDHSSLMGDVVLVPSDGAATAAALPAPRPEPAPAPAPATAPSRPPQVVARTEAPPSRPPRPRMAGESCATRSAETGADLYCASSTLDPQAGNSYDVRNLFGSNPGTAWIEGKVGDGAGERITIEFDSHRLVKALVIHNGYQKSQDIYQKNGRVRRLRAVFSSGETMNFTLQDRQGGQTLTLDRPLHAYWMQLVIDDVYPGSRFTDTALSKVLVTSERVP
jgi:hypothetical protein